MGLINTEAIVLRTYKLAEADKIVVCLTRQTGVVRGVARGARRLKSKFGASLEPFTLIALVYYEKEGRELVSLQQVEILRSYFSLAQSTEIVHAMEYLSELVLEFTPPQEPNDKLFRMVRACAEALAEVPEALPALVRYFEVWTLRLAGFLPNSRGCAGCSRRFEDGENVYLSGDNGLRCRACAGGTGIALAGEAYAQLRAIQKVGPVEFSRAVRSVRVAVWQELAQVTQVLIARALEREPRGQATFT
ncbi:MAG: DNA repair protein RecO [Pyrinomonadaceae bacterium]|nr:DNA repair protein RecO [Pyrinomonadaceae bacterium]